MSGKSHFVADRFTRALRMNSREVPSRRDAVGERQTGASPLNQTPDSSSESLKTRTIYDEDSISSNMKGLRLQSGRSASCGNKRAAAGSPHGQASEGGNRPNTRSGSIDDTIGRSVTLSPEMKDFDLQGRPAPSNSNKRAFAEPAHGQERETGPRPTKFRTASLDDSYGKGSTHHQSQPAYYDAARDKSSSIAVSPPLQASALQDSSKTRPHPDGYTTTRPPQRNTGFIPAPKIPQLFLDSQNSSLSANPETESLASNSPDTTPAFNRSSDYGSSMLLQPETRSITQEQLVNEVKGIYAGLVMVEKKCVEIDQQQSSTTNKFSNEQWQALIALHRTLLHEHHDFFLASQHPSSSPALRRLATKYAMPARMWRHGIHSFLELLRHRLPDSLDHMLAFVYLAYSMMALLMESVPSFEETWIECLGDLARYRMVIEEADLRDREVWSGVARMWYNRASDKSPNVGRIQHHLAVLARPNIVQQLFYYSKALVSVIPFQNARESIMLLFNPFLEGSEIASQSYPLVESELVKANGVQFTHGGILKHTSLMEQFYSILDNHIGPVTATLRVQGPEFMSSLCAAIFHFGNSHRCPLQALTDQDYHWRTYVEPDDSVLSAPYRIRAFSGKDRLPKSHQVKMQSLTDFSKRRHDGLKRLLGTQMKDSQHVEIFGEPTQPIHVLQMAGFSSRHYCMNHGPHPLHPLQQFSPNGTLGDQTEIIHETQSLNIEPDAKNALRVWLRGLALKVNIIEAFTNVGRVRGIRHYQWLKSDFYWQGFLHTERSILRQAGASLQNFQVRTCRTLSAFMWHGSMATTIFFLMRGLPTAHADPTNAPSTTGDLGNPEMWFNFEKICHILGWASASSVGAFVVYLEVRGPKRDLARYYVLSFGSAGASLVLLDSRAAAAVRWPTLFVGIIFLVRLWLKVSELYKMSYGWLGPIFGLAILFDTSLVHLTGSSSGGGQGLFFQLVLLCFCFALSLCAGLARFVRYARAENRRDHSSRLEDGRRPDVNSGPGGTMEQDEPAS